MKDDELKEIADKINILHNKRTKAIRSAQAIKSVASRLQNKLVQDMKIHTSKEAMLEETIRDLSEALRKSPSRNDVLEEVAKEMERFTFAFGVDTVASFTAFVRGMKE